MSGDCRATLILENGLVRTMDPAAPRAEAVALAGGRILAVGSTGEMGRWAGRSTRRVDLGGRLCLPGFMDSHFHYFQWATGRAQARLDQARDFQQCMELISGQAHKTPAGGWVQGQGFNESDWPENRMPDRRELDRAAPDHPVMIWRCDLHLAVANTEALRRAGVGDHTPDPVDGTLDRDQNGGLTGVLREGAAAMVRSAIPLVGLEQLLPIMDQAQGAVHALGFTGLHDVRLADVRRESAVTLGAWQKLREQDRLALRCWTSIPGECRSLAQGLGLRTGFGDDFLRMGHVKYFFDGGMGARTGWMLEPYADTGERGMCVYPPEELFEEMRSCHESGLAVMVHSIGDRASRELVSLFERLLTPERRAMASAPALAHRMEHAQVIRPGDIRRLAKLGVPVSMMPANMVLDINMINQCAPSVVPHAYPFRTMLDAGVEVMFSADCPVCDPNPLVNIQAAVTRQREDGTPEGGWSPGLRVGVEEAVRAYTATPARAYGLQDVSGTLGPGKYADMVVLEQDIFSIDPLDIARTRVSMTVFDGRIVHEQ